MDKIRWGIIGTGNIARQFAEGLQCVQDAKLAAVASRQAETARAFAAEYGAEAAYDDYEKMLETERPELVYIATPNDCHMESVMRTLEAGVNVLCEKPMADNCRQLEEMLAKAKEKNLFLMEGMWTRCFPAVRKAREWMAQGKIGRTLGVHAYFGIKTVEEDWQPWKAGLAHAGGALRDVGIYSLAMAQMGFGESPQKICSTYVTNGEVDIHADLMLQYSDCRTAFLTAAFDTVTEHEAVIIGEKGQIVIGEKFWRPSKAELYTEGASIFGNRLEETFEEPYEATGFQYEIRRVQECLRRGLTECPDFTWDDSMEICRMIDGLRKDWGIAYASDSCGM